MKHVLAALVALSLVIAPLVMPGTANAWNGGVHGAQPFPPGHFHGGPPFPHGHFHDGHFHHGGCCFFGGFGAGVFTGAVVGSAFAPAYAYPAPVYAYPVPDYAPPPPPTYWYYCRSLGAYYPYVPNCPEPWVPVLPQ
jgi:hypothetical protein